jgi:hypothetical protein
MGFAATIIQEETIKDSEKNDLASLIFLLLSVER